MPAPGPPDAAAERLPGDVSAIVLAGGRSSRMGMPKALLPFGGEPLIVRIVRTLGSVFERVTVVAAADQRLPELPAEVIRDEQPHLGPVAGLCYGLRGSDTERSFVVACDSPFLNTGLIAHLVARAGDCDVVVPEWDGRPQPLHAVYRTAVLPIVEEQLAGGRLKLADLVERLRALRIGGDEIRRFDPEGTSFFTMNTEAEYREALARLGTQDGAAR